MNMATVPSLNFIPAIAPMIAPTGPPAIIPTAIPPVVIPTGISGTRFSAPCVI